MIELPILLDKAKATRLNAYAPYSRFFVGACLETTQGNVYTGCNVENASYGIGVCAESNAIASMIAAGDRQIRQIVVVVEGKGVSAPCGACRQRLYEFATSDTIIHLCDLFGNHEQYTMQQLLPHAFGPHDLDMPVI
jgi:cytidine deaminase